MPPVVWTEDFVIILGLNCLTYHGIKSRGLGLKPTSSLLLEKVCGKFNRHAMLPAKLFACVAIRIHSVEFFVYRSQNKQERGSILVLKLLFKYYKNFKIMVFELSIAKSILVHLYSLLIDSLINQINVLHEH